MQAIILAAGMGTRLEEFTKDNTKCMVKIAGRRIIDRAIESISYAGIDHVIIVIGYKGKELKEYLEKEYADSDMTFEFIENEIFSTSNNIYSLYMARDFLSRDDTILIESDIVFEKELILRTVENPSKDIAIVDHYQDWMSGSVVSGIDGIVTEFTDNKHMDYTKLDRYYKTVNIYKLSKEFCKESYLPHLKDHIDKGMIDLYYEDVLKNMLRVSDKLQIKMELVGLKWYEIDNPQDLDIANVIFSDNETKYDILMSRFGGYWKYPPIKDFNLIVNQHYPTDAMMAKIRSECGTLIKDYPSNLDVQNTYAGHYFDVKPKHVVVGNGASELINALGQISSGTITVPVPTFNEYIRCFHNCKIRYIENKKNDFVPSLDDYLSAARNSDILCIVNPDNPSGFMFSKDDIMIIVEECKKCDTKLIVDESFVDFADPEVRYTLLDERILSKYPNVIIIRSMGKTHGIPGLRLGVLATCDQQLIDRIKGVMSIWNVNSFAEYYLQICNNFSDEYIQSCDRTSSERKRIFGSINGIKGITAYPSQANYLMINTGKYSSRDICVKALSYGLLLKDLSNKDFFDNGNFIRVAIRTREDNDLLIDVLGRIMSGY